MIKFSSQRSHHGNAILEFALVAMLFITILLTIAELSLMFWVTLSMQHAVREGARFSITGLTTGAPPTDPTRYNAVIARIRDQSMGLYDAVSPVIVVQTVDNSGVLNVVGGKSFGDPGQIVVIRLDCQWPLITPFLKPFFANGRYDFSVSATMRNENFTP
ncbi:MAG: TadE/TadG family type IV pilus assembly protein [bacterium]|nr:TadE/TadG family type IV pilus assembly protein [bacterium]